MNTFTTYAILAFCAIEACSASTPARALETRQVPIARFYFETQTSGSSTFSQSVPEDGKTYPIISTDEVFLIFPDDTQSNCTFIGADGTHTIVQGGIKPLLAPQRQVSVTCDARSGPAVPLTEESQLFPSQFATTAAPLSSATGSFTTKPASNSAVGSIIPPYPIGTGSYMDVGYIGASVPAASGAALATGGFGNGTIVPFTGDATRTAKSIGGSLIAFVGLIVAL